MKASELRVGNKITRKSNPDVICTVNWGIIKEFERSEWHEYIPLPITEKLLLNLLGCRKNGSVLPSYEIYIEADGYYKAISLQYNNDNSTHQYYCWCRKGNIEDDRSDDDIICLRKDLRYVHQFQNIVLDILNKEI